MKVWTSCFESNATPWAKSACPRGRLWRPDRPRAGEFPDRRAALPRSFIRALGLIKSAAARVNGRLGRLPADRAAAIEAAANEVAGGRWDGEFPLDIFQTGSGTSTNMNANEVIGRWAARRIPTMT